jgi:hypothetical protein
MPYVGDDVHRATTKRKWDHDGSDTLRFSHPGSNTAVFHVLNQQAGLESTADGISTRKTLPPTKRLRAIHDDTDNITHSSHWRNASSLLVTTSQVSNDSACKGPVKIGGMTIMPCHVCHRRPTKKSDLDSFARCQSCQEQTCFVCIRECRRQKDVKSPSFEKQDEDVGQSFNMNDADECDMAAATNIHAPHHDDDTRQDISNKSSTNSSVHHAMICSRCCVEEGAEGEVVCLGCLSNMDTA